MALDMAPSGRAAEPAERATAWAPGCRCPVRRRTHRSIKNIPCGEKKKRNLVRESFHKKASPR